MVALKASEVPRFLQKPTERAPVVLVFGPDEGLVSERARSIVTASSGGVDDPFSLVRMTGADVSEDPARLIDEASTLSMFGNRRVVWLREPGRANILAAIEPLLARTDLQSLVVVEAGDLKKGTGLRKRIEDHPMAVAIACYADNATDLGRLIEEEAKLAGLRIEPAARQALEALLGSDRLASRGEVRKLCLYAHGKGTIEEGDVAAIVGDASAFAMDELIDAVAGGDPAAADGVFRRLQAAGTHPSAVGSMLIRHFHALQRGRATVESGTNASDVVERMQPPIFSRRRPEVVKQLGLWPMPRIERALVLIDEAMLQSRLKPSLAGSIIGDAMLQLARAARANLR